MLSFSNICMLYFQFQVGLSDNVVYKCNDVQEPAIILERLKLSVHRNLQLANFKNQNQRDQKYLLHIAHMFLLPLISVRNSSCLTLLLCISIFSVKSKVKRNLCSSYRPRAAYLYTSKVINSMMLAMRLLVIGLLEELFEKNLRADRKRRVLFNLQDNSSIELQL